MRTSLVVALCVFTLLVVAVDLFFAHAAQTPKGMPSPKIDFQPFDTSNGVVVTRVLTTGYTPDVRAQIVGFSCTGQGNNVQCFVASR